LEVADVLAEAAVETANAKVGPLDLNDLQNKRLGYAAEGLGLEGLLDILASEE